MLEAGASKIKITPPIGVPMDGYLSRTTPSIGIHDHIYARCLSISDGENYLALASIELLYVTRDLTSKVRKIISNELGIPKESVILTAVHNHSGPSIVGFHLTQEYGFLNEYLNLLPGFISSGLIEAFNSKCKVRVGYGRGRVKGWTINRRRTTSGPVDEELLAVRFEGENGRLISSIVNFTCHAVVLGANNLLISGDYPGYVSRTVEKVEGGVCLFLNGAFGDINPLTPNTRVDRIYDRNVGCFEDAIRMGRAIGGEALKTLNSACLTDSTLSLVNRKVRLKLKSIPKFTDEDLKKLKTRLKRANVKESEKIKFNIFSAKFCNLINEMFPSGIAEVEVQGFRIGNLMAVLLPGEPFVSLGLKIKAYSKADVTMVVGCANENIGYIPTEEAMDEGGYEVNLPVCIVEREAGRLLVEAACNIIEDLLGR